MAAKSKIEWTDATWNPIGGCSIKSPGCASCYAQKLAGTRLKAHALYAGVTDMVKGKPVFNGKLTAVPPDHPVWTWPLRWRGAKAPKLGPGMPSLIFVGDMSDLFHEDRSLGYFMRVLYVGLRSPHIVQVLTKRTAVLARAVAMWMDVAGEDFGAFINARGPAAVRAAHRSGRAELFALMLETMGEPPPGCAYPTFDWMEGPLYWPAVLSRLWLGFSAERQKEFDERWAHMRPLAAAGWTVYVSYEPAIGPLHLPDDFLALGPRAQVIAGGMSGQEATPSHPNWFRYVRDQCAAAGMPFFFKQWGSWVPHKVVTGGDLAGDVRAGRVQIVHPSGREGHEILKETGSRQTERGSLYMANVGKKTAGRLLDGREHNEFPAR